MTNIRRLQIALGALWLVDAALQCQPYMFSTRFADDVLAGPATPVADLVRQAPVVFNLVVIAVQLGIGLALLFRRTARAGLVGSVVWGLAIWVVGEGFGGLPRGNVTLLTGAPGAALLYAVIAAVAWPRPEARGAAAQRIALASWVVLWTGGAVVQLLPGQSPAATAHVPHDTEVAVALALVQLLVGALALVAGASRRAALVAGVALAATFFVFGPALADLTTGEATDPGTAPLLVLLALAVAYVAGSGATSPVPARTTASPVRLRTVVQPTP